MNILAYSGATTLEIATKDGKKHRGSAPEVIRDDDYGEPCLSITTQQGIIDFPQRDIRSIRVLEMPEIDPAAKAAELRERGWPEELIAETLTVYDTAIRQRAVRPTTDWRI